MTEAKTKTITVKTDEAKPVDVEILAEAIIKVSDGFAMMQRSRVKERVILLLIQDASGVPLGTVSKVLKAAADLKKMYIK